MAVHIFTEDFISSLHIQGFLSSPQAAERTLLPLPVLSAIWSLILYSVINGLDKLTGMSVRGKDSISSILHAFPLLFTLEEFLQFWHSWYQIMHIIPYLACLGYFHTFSESLHPTCSLLPVTFICVIWIPFWRARLMKFN